jgi:anti-sigma regulatory factor (Ser/Thr protein kinase)
METGRMRFHHGEYDVLDTTRRAVAAMADRMAEARQQLVEDLPRGPFTAWGDANRLQRGILQLLDNAAKFTPEGGTVGVRVRKLQSGHYEICVADSGPGIRPDRASRIFEPFYQVDGSVTREHGGVGVGLAIARRTARGLGGDLRVVSPSSEIIEGIVLGGAAFYLSVSPRAPLDGGSDSRPPVASSSRPGLRPDEQGTAAGVPAPRAPSDSRPVIVVGPVHVGGDPRTPATGVPVGPPAAPSTTGLPPASYPGEPSGPGEGGGLRRGK